MDDNFKGKEQKLLHFINAHPARSSKEIHEGLEEVLGYATIKRALQKLLSENWI